jgi:hypothetical protein
MTQSKDSSAKFFMLLASASSSLLNKKVTFERWIVVLSFIFQLHILNHNLRKVRACNFVVPFDIHILAKWGVPFFTFILYLLLRLEFCCLFLWIGRLYLWCFPSFDTNRTQWNFYIINELLCVSFFPESLLAIVTILFKVHLGLL